MVMYAMTVTEEWGVNNGQLLFARVACEFAAENSMAARAGVLAIHVRYLEPENRAPLGFRCLLD